MKEYFLFLDESKPNQEIRHFCLGGCIIEKEHYIKDIIPYINKLKKDVFDSKDIILHETEIRQSKDKYLNMRNLEKRNLFWDGMKKLFDEFNLKST